MTSSSQEPMEAVTVGQVRAHRDTGLTMEVLRPEPGRYGSPGWIVRYIPAPPRGRAERWYDDDSLRRFYPPTELGDTP